MSLQPPYCRNENQNHRQFGLHPPSIWNLELKSPGQIGPRKLLCFPNTKYNSKSQNLLYKNINRSINNNNTILI